MNAKTFFAELKRRKVYSLAIGYVVGGWALAQGLAQVLPVFDIPNWVVRLLVVLIVLGFPVALTLSWFFDLTRYGIVRTPDRAPEPRIGSIDPSISQEKSIAVLPFKDLSARSERDHVVEGSIRRDGNRIRVTAELTECGKGFSLWSETFEREFQGIFALQDEITRSIVDALKLKLEIAPATPRAQSMEAYDLYLQGLFLSDKSGEEALRKSLEFFEQALDKDPRFARAWTGIAKSWLWLADAYVKPVEAYSKVREAAVNAIQIDDGEAEAHVYLAETKRILDWDLGGAEIEYIRAFEIDSNSTTSNYFIAAFYAAIGERDKALGYLSRTAKIDPASLWVSNFACEIYRYFGLIDEAMAAGERSLQLDPTFLYGEPLLAALYREMGRFDDAIALYKKSQDISGRVPFGLAFTYAKMNRRSEAREILKNARAS